jgi:hypothetical protein
MSKKTLVIHPFFFAAFPILFLFAHNIGQLSLNVIFIPIAIIGFFTLLFWSSLSLVLKDKQKAGLIVSLFLLLFFSYGHFYRVVNATGFRFDLGLIFIETSRVLLVLWGILFFLGFSFCITTHRNLHKLTSLLNITASFLIVIPLMTIGTYKLKARNTWPDTISEGNVKINPGHFGEADTLPNIYFIILDAYARADILEEIYGYQNTEFISYLTQKGFYIANKSRSNYCQTNLSLASCLNFKYLDFLVKRVDVESNDHGPLKNMIKNSRVFNFLKQYGYRIVAFSSGYSGTEIKEADIYITCGRTLDEFQNELLNTTPIPVVLRMFKRYNRFDLHRKKLLSIIDHLVNTCELKSPIFVFAHIKAPHPPFVFGQHGEKADPPTGFTDHDGNWLIRKGKLTRDEYLKGYRDQLIFINDKIKGALGDILLKSKTPPIIILQADHGPRSMLVWEDPGKTNFKECMSILNAYYLPNNGDAHLYDEITPVNTFRIIFNHYFGTDYELLEDKSYFSTAKHPYKFMDVTDKMDSVVYARHPE